MDEELLTRIRKEAYEQGYQDGKVEGYNLAGAKLIKRKKGKWKPFDRTWGRSIYHCTACGEAEDCPTEMGKVIWRFCPNCGAEMDERSEND